MMQTRAKQLPNPPIEFGGDQLRWATWLYYAEARTQAEVAQALGVSRATVANYLAEARRQGLVTIAVDSELLAGVGLGRALSERFGLLGAHIIPDPDEDEEIESLRSRIGAAAAHVVVDRLADGETLGVAWGRTMLAFARALPERDMPKLRVVQVSGSSLGGDDISPEFCTTLIASRLGARCLNFHAPSVVSSASMRDALLNEPALVRHFEAIRACGRIVFGVGEVSSESIFAGEDQLPPEMLDTYLESGAVGVALFRFFDAHGAEIDGPISGRRIGITIDELLAVPERICAAGGPEKIAALRAVLEGELATHLVTNAKTARGLLED